MTALRCLALALATLTLLACSNGATSNSGWSPTQFTFKDVGSNLQSGDSSVSDVPISDAASDTMQAGPDATCSCAGLECGDVAGCPGLYCGDCPKGAVCQNHVCEADPDCSCGPQDCGKLFCGKDCGGCDQGMTCLNNFCTFDCSCAGIECGQLPGCDAPCGDCASGKTCKGYQCVADPACTCKAGQCGVLTGSGGKPCPNNCGNCGTGETCSANKCTSGGADCPCNGIACGFSKTSCSKSCGMCQINQYCSANKCLLDDPQAKKKFGEPCGSTELCPVPQLGAPQYAQNAYQACLDKQCLDGICLQGVCSRKCKIAADSQNNVTGAPGPDGIEDPGQPSDCMGAAVGPAGGSFRCVEQNSPALVAGGLSLPKCLPGTTFAPCTTSADCTPGELCRVVPIYGDFQARCAPKLSNPVGTAAVGPSQACNLDVNISTLALCETGWCTWQGCVALCNKDADCVTAKGSCSASKCVVNGNKCASDADCPTWVCKPAIAYNSISSAATFKACQPQ